MMNLCNCAQAFPANLPGRPKLRRKLRGERLASVSKSVQRCLIVVHLLPGLDTQKDDPTSKSCHNSKEERREVFKRRLIAQLTQHVAPVAKHHHSENNKGPCFIARRQFVVGLAALGPTLLNMFSNVEGPSLIQRINLLTGLQNSEALCQSLHFAVRETTCRSDLFEHA